MEKLVVFYYVRSGFSRITARTLIHAAQSIGAVPRMKLPKVPLLLYSPETGASATRKPFFGGRAVVICPLGPGRASALAVRPPPGPATYGGMTGTKNERDFAPGAPTLASAAVLSQLGTANDPLRAAEDPFELVADIRMKELLSAIVANSKACQNWLSKATPNLERARISIAHVMRDVNDLTRMLE